MLLQIFTFSGNALSKPYVNLYLVALGVSASQLGIILSIGALLEMAVIPVMTSAADHRGKHRLLYTGFIGTLAVGNVLLVSSDWFWSLALAAVLIEMAFRPTASLGFQLVITQVHNEGRNIAGRIRGISSLGFGLASLVAGPLFALAGYTGLFLSAVASYLGGLVFRDSLPESISDPVNSEPETQTPPVPHNRGFYLLMVSMFFLMMAHRAGYAFWFVHFQQNLGVSTGEIGRLAALMALVEIPFFVLLDPLLTRIDVRLAFILGGLGMSAVWLGTGFLPSRGWIYPLLLLRGGVFSAFYLTTFLVIVQISAPQNVATNQALLQGTIPSLATVLTSPLSGWLYDVAGPKALYSAITVVSLIGIGIVIAGYHLLKPVPEAAV
ncbi:MAG: MFS transporter [Anaerolineae bacterium]|nr:MFS transporter [Anaerolineae bacterium]